jgi:hypothetical protein
VVKPKKEEKKFEEKQIIKEEEKIEEPKKEEIKLKAKIEEPKDKIPKEEKKEMPFIEEQKNEENKIKEILLDNVEYKKKDKPNELIEENKPLQIKENKVSGIDKSRWPETLLTKKTKDNYDLLLKHFKKDNFKSDDINNLINYDDFTNDEFIGLATEKKELNKKNKEIRDIFLKRIQKDTKRRQENKETINNRIKLIEDCNNKKMFFGNLNEKKKLF